MNAQGMAALLAASLAACGDPSAPGSDPGPEHPDRFGTVAFHIDGGPWISIRARDSGIARFEPHTRGLWIRADSNNQVGRLLGVTLRLCGIPAEQVYAGRAISGLWVVPARVAQTRSDRPLWFYSDGLDSDSLVLEEYSLNAARIRGRFSFTASPHGGSTTHRVRGKFAGKLGLGGIGVCPEALH